MSNLISRRLPPIPPRLHSLLPHRYSWKKIVRSVCLFSALAASVPATSQSAAAEAPPSRAELAQRYGHLPLSFEANQGQAPKAVEFLARGPGYALYLTNSEAVLSLHRPNSAADTVRMQLPGARAHLHPAGIDPLPGTVSYLVGKDSTRWHTSVPTYAQVRYSQVYPGVDLLYYGDQQRLEYDFAVAAGADPSPIRLRFAQAKSVKLDSHGNLLIATSHGHLAFSKPHLYQIAEGKRHPVEGGFRLLGRHSAGFTLGSYDRGKALVIDPILSYATYLGGSGQDSALSIALDADGNTYIAGQTSSIDFPVTTGSFEARNYAPAANGVSTAFISKLNPSGTALIYSTYLGGNATAPGETGVGAFARSIAVDSSSNAYVTGWTDAFDFPVTPGVRQSTNYAVLKHGVTGFVSKLNPAGTGLLYSTYLGGSTNDLPTTIALDSSGNAYVAGYTASTDFPLTNGALQTTNRSPGGWNLFVSHLNSTATGLLYSTYLGGTGESAATLQAIAAPATTGLYAPVGLAIDQSGDAYIEGFARSIDFPVTTGAYQPSNRASASQGANLTLTKLNPTGTAMLYSTYLGGSGYPGDYSAALAIDALGNAYATGFTYSSDFPTTAGAFQTAKRASAETAFVTKINATGTALLYSTFLGGSAHDDGYAVAVTAGGNAYVAGQTASSDFPATPGAFQSANKAAPGDTTAFLAELAADGSALAYSTYIGGSAEDAAYGIALNSAAVYLTGATSSPDFPVTPNAFQSTDHSTHSAAFVAAFDLAPPSTQATVTTLQASVNPQHSNAPVTFTAKVAPLTGPGTPSGHIVFSIDDVAVSTVALDNSGSAGYSLPSLPIGEHSILAGYQGNATFASSGENLTETILLPAPSIASLVPTVAVVGATGFTLTINGSNFYAGASVSWGSTALSTVVVSASQLTASVPTSLLASAGSAPITVTSAGGTSSPATFTILPANGIPLALDLAPASVIAAGGSFTLTVTGANFTQNSRLLWQGALRTTNFVSQTQLTATILASDIKVPITALVTIADPAPNAATSAAIPFAVAAASPVPTLSGASLANAVDGNGNSMLAITGTGFLAEGSTVQWNGASIPATCISPWQLSALLPANDGPPPSAITVSNPAITSAPFEIR